MKHSRRLNERPHPLSLSREFPFLPDSVLSICFIGDVHVSLAEDGEERMSRIIGDIGAFSDSMSSSEQSNEYYRANRNADIGRVSSDQCVGKKGEFLSEICLRRRFGFPEIGIDVEVRDGGSKGWTCDLDYGSIGSELPRVHVKSCSRWTLDFCNDYSWTWQWSNRSSVYGRDDIFSLSDCSTDIVSLVYIEDNESTDGIIKAMLPWALIRTLLKDPMKESLVGLKKNLYFKDIPSLL